MGARQGHSGGLFFGWWVMLASFVGMVFGTAAILVFSLGVFIQPLQQEFGWTRAQISVAAAIIVWVSVLTQPIQGILIDRYGVRRVVLPSIPIFSVPLALLYFLPANIFVFYVAWIVITFCGLALWNGSYNKVMAAWFDRKLGLAVGIVSAGQGAGAALVPALSQSLISHFGWRLAYVGLAAITLVVTLIFNLLFLRDKPADKGLQPDGDRGPHVAASGTPAIASGYSFRQSVRLKSFWIIATAFFLLGTMSTALVTHQVPMLIDGGLQPARAALVASAFGVSLIVGRLVAGVLLDWIFAPYVMVATLLGPIAGLLMYARGSTGDEAFLWSALIGFGVGAEFDVLGYLIPRYFGRQAFGKLYGVLLAAFQFGGGIGAAILGVIRTTHGNYTPGLWGILATTSLAALLFATLGPYAMPAPRGDAADISPTADARSQP
jgi:MFS family permease